MASSPQELPPYFGCFVLMVSIMFHDAPVALCTAVCNTGRLEKFCPQGSWKNGGEGTGQEITF